VEPRFGVWTTVVLPRPLHASDAASGRQRRDDGDTRTAGHDGMVVRVELSTYVRVERAERITPRRHATQRGKDCSAAVDIGGERARHSGPSVHGNVPGHTADVSDRRLYAAGVAAQYRD